jgi:Kef-type K+ transport system membrane component KefB
MIFLMLSAGLETDFTKISKLKKKIFFMAGLNGIVPFTTGFLITYFFGYSLLESLLIGIIFVSSSVALIVPTLRGAGILKKDIGQIILSSVMLTDIVSLLALSAVLQSTNPITHLPLSIYYIVLILSLVFLFWLAPKLVFYFLNNYFKKKTLHEKKLRFVIVFVIATLVYFSFLGVEPILAAFIVGMILSGVVRSKEIKEHISILSYGLFVPIFFFVIGMEMDISMLTHLSRQNLIIILIVVGLIISKFVSGYVGGRISKLSIKESATYGSSSIIQLTTTLVVVYASSEAGIMSHNLVTSVIILSIITTIIGPIALRLFLGKKAKNME